MDLAEKLLFFFLGILFVGWLFFDLETIDSIFMISFFNLGMILWLVEKEEGRKRHKEFEEWAAQQRVKAFGSSFSEDFSENLDEEKI